MLESGAGRLVVANVSMRTEPDKMFAESLAHIVDDPEFTLVSNTRLQGEFEARHGYSIELLEVDLDQDDPIGATGAVPRMLAEAVRNGLDGATSASAFRKEITRRVAAEWETIRTRFISGLNPELVAQTRLNGALTPSGYSYVSTVSPEIRRNRAQALELFPILRTLLMTSGYTEVLSAVDTGRPLVDVLAEKWSAPKALVRNLKGVRFRDLGSSLRSLTTLIQLLREIPPDWWPRDQETWQRFGRVLETIAQLTKRPTTTPANLLWLREAARKKFCVIERTPEEYVRIGEDIDDFLDMLDRALTWTKTEIRRSRPKATFRPTFETVTSLRISLGLERLARTATRFGNAYRRAEESYADEAALWKGVRWPVPGNLDMRHYSGVVVHALLTPAELRDEGKRMGNCVASYVGLCLRGLSQIWSLRLESGEALSTLETKIQSAPTGNKYLQVVQHKGVLNGPPPPEAQFALTEFLSDLRSTPDQLEDYFAWRRKVMRRPLSERQQYALMQPVIMALAHVLPKQWSWETISAETTASSIPKNDGGALQ